MVLLQGPERFEPTVNESTISICTPFPIPLMTPPVTTIYFFSFLVTSVLTSFSWVFDFAAMLDDGMLLKNPVAELIQVTAIISASNEEVIVNARIPEQLNFTTKGRLMIPVDLLLFSKMLNCNCS